MKAATQIQPPANWQDFETLCKKLWGEIWNCSDTIKKNGRLGQAQYGVDIYGTPNNGTEYYGIQCKGKGHYTQAQLSKQEIDAEIHKAKNFKPRLKSLYFVTTAVKDAYIEEYIRLKNIESQNAGSFGIEIFFWEDIVDKLIENRNTYNWYVNNYQYIDRSDVDVQVIGDNFKLTPIVLKKTTKYSLHPFKEGSINRILFDLQNPKISLPHYSLINRPIKKNYSWCEINFKITNTGSTVLSDYHLIISFTNGVKDYKIGTSHCNNPLINPAEELFYSELYDYSVEFRPKNTKLVQGDSRCFELSILTDLYAKEVIIKWIFLSNGYKKTDNIRIEVSNIIEEQIENIYVDSDKDLQPNKSKLVYKEE